MKRAFYIVCLACLGLWGCDSDSSHSQESDQIEDSCGGVTATICHEGNVVSCVNGEIKTETCEQGCENGACLKADAPCVDGASCDGNLLIVCKDGVESSLSCANGCENGECKSLVGCGEDSAVCEGDELVTCKDGVSHSRTCPEGCENGACIDSGSECGNNKIEGNEYCDFKKLGEMTCYDVEGADPSARYLGSPVCNETCDGVLRGTCEVSYCGNGAIDTEDGEICDTVEGVVSFTGGTPSCEDYFGTIPTYKDYAIKDGGMPGCSSDCKAYTKGTCELEQQSMLGLEKCQFLSFEKDETEETMTATALVRPVEGILEKNINGKLACGHKDDNATYVWGSVTARHLSCEDCDEGVYKMVADFSYALKTAGSYDCVFQIDVDDGTASTEYLNCPIEFGYPVPQGMATDAIIRSYEVPQKEVQGEILAHWDFTDYQKNETATTISANDGVFASTSSLRLSDDSKMTMVTKEGDLSDLCPKSDWDYSETVAPESLKHFEFTTSSTGYQNIQIQFNVAGSGENLTKKVQVYVQVGDVYTAVGEAHEFGGDRIFSAFGPETVPNDVANNQASFRVNVYPFGMVDSNGWSSSAAIRIDDVYILGSRIE